MKERKAVLYGVTDAKTIIPIKIDDDGYIIIKEYTE